MAEAGAKRKSKSRPERTCVVCGAKGPKDLRLRIAGKAGGPFQIDPAATLPGRGVYVCRTAECVEGFARKAAARRGAGRLRVGAAAPELALRLMQWWKDDAK